MQKIHNKFSDIFFQELGALKVCLAYRLRIAVSHTWYSQESSICTQRTPQAGTGQTTEQQIIVYLGVDET